MPLDKTKTFDEKLEGKWNWTNISEGGTLTISFLRKYMFDERLVKEDGESVWVWRLLAINPSICEEFLEEVKNDCRLRDSKGIPKWFSRQRELEILFDIHYHKTQMESGGNKLFHESQLKKLLNF